MLRKYTRRLQPCVPTLEYSTVDLYKQKLRIDTEYFTQ